MAAALSGTVHHRSATVAWIECLRADARLIDDHILCDEYAGQTHKSCCWGPRAGDEQPTAREV